jgi:hypothetical protein
MSNEHFVQKTTYKLHFFGRDKSGKLSMAVIFWRNALMPDLVDLLSNPDSAE